MKPGYAASLKASAEVKEETSARAAPSNETAATKPTASVEDVLTKVDSTDVKQQDATPVTFGTLDNAPLTKASVFAKDYGEAEVMKQKPELRVWAKSAIESAMVLREKKNLRQAAQLLEQVGISFGCFWA